jgi:hypothetical protein
MDQMSDAIYKDRGLPGTALQIREGRACREQSGSHLLEFLPGVGALKMLTDGCFGLLLQRFFFISLDEREEREL